MKKLRYILIGFILVLIAVQFIPVDLPETTNENPGDIMQGNLVPQDVALLLKTSCYSCHSNETEYPWYSRVAPSSWLVARDVRVGRDELNFSNWAAYDQRKALKKLDDIYTEVDEGRMPMPIYTFMHPSAKLSEEQRKRIVAWSEAAMESIAGEEDEMEEKQ